jgi:CheY-like chemotaxis protein
LIVISTSANSSSPVSMPRQRWKPSGAIVLDIGLPDTDGYEVARLIRQQPSGQVKLMIAVTGWGQEADKQAAKNAGFDFHFTKPVDLDRLLAVLNQHAP